ncbi:MAG: tyrosine-protein phosphatase [Bacteroidales bacterium]|nr:tyrosine-protein phosphatase [Bacteroidales bacterium]
MIRYILISFMMTLFCACQANQSDEAIELNKQQIGITSIHNARQLGGYRIGNKQIKDGLLLRTARLSGLSEEDSTLLADRYRVQCIYDFRGQEESMTAPDVIPGDSRYMNLSISLDEGGDRSAFKADSEAEMIGMLLKYADNPMIQDLCAHMYDKILFEESSQEVYRRFFADLVTVNPEDGAVLWHCTQGKDRAGCASALLLSALGAERELIMADFNLSKEYYDPYVATINIENETQSHVINTLISVNPVVFEEALDKIDERYGSLRNYLTECIGVTPEMMEILRERYLE